MLWYDIFFLHDINEQNPSCQVSFNRHRPNWPRWHWCQGMSGCLAVACKAIHRLSLSGRGSPRKGQDSSNHVKSGRTEPQSGLIDVIDGLIISLPAIVHRDSGTIRMNKSGRIRFYHEAPRLFLCVTLPLTVLRVHTFELYFPQE